MLYSVLRIANYYLIKYYCEAELKRLIKNSKRALLILYFLVLVHNVFKWTSKYYNDLIVG